MVFIAPRNKAGASVLSRRKSAKVTNLDDITKAELQFARVYSATLKATGWSWRYISDTVNIQGSLVKAWADDPEWIAMVEKVAGDIVEGSVEHLKRHSIDLTEMLLELARKTTDDAVKLRAIESGLDRVGVTKVNKSESIVTKKDQQEHSLAADLFERMEGLPLETQQKIAALATELDELVTSARGTE
jgi:hypothetical protein